MLHIELLAACGYLHLLKLHGTCRYPTQRVLAQTELRAVRGTRLATRYYVMRYDASPDRSYRNLDRL